MSRSDVAGKFSFPEAVSLAEELLGAIERQELTGQAVREKVGMLVSSVAGARGFFVAYLTGTFAVSDEPSQPILSAFEDNAEIVCDLVAKNLVMSTTMSVTHERNGDRLAADDRLAWLAVAASSLVFWRFQL